MVSSSDTTSFASSSTANTNTGGAVSPTGNNQGASTNAPASPNTPARGTDKVELSGGTRQLSTPQQKEVDDLKKRDADVHRHEEAHLAAAGGYARGGATYDYQTGPDGKQYAVGGEVQIDSGPVPNNPQATIQKEQTVQRAALAPADPSGEDQAVAAQAGAAEAKARAELVQQKSGYGGTGKTPTEKLIDVAA